MSNVFWDSNYASDDFKYGTAPNAFLLGNANLLQGCTTILVPGDGEGRNSAWLAGQGYKTISQDGSRVGQEKAKRLAVQHGVEIQFVLADLASWVPQPASVDAVVLTYVHLPPEIRKTVHRRIVNALKPGGIILLEAFHPLQLGFTSGGPKSEDMLYTRTLLREDFQDLVIEEWSIETETLLAEGKGHQGAAFVTRFVGRRSPCPFET